MNRIKIMKRNFFIKIIAAAVILLCFSAAYSQTSETKANVDKKAEQKTETFIDSFMQSYKQTLDLTKIPESYFIGNYKKAIKESLFITDYDKILTEDEKFRNHCMFLDFSSLTLISKLDESNYDVKKAFGNPDGEMFPKRIKQAFEKYPKAKILLLKQDFPKIKTVSDYRSVIQDFQKVVQEIRESINTEKRDKFFNFLTANKEKLFKLGDDYKCSEDDCEGLREGTRLFDYMGLPFYFLLADDEGQLKIVKVIQPHD